MRLCLLKGTFGAGLQLSTRGLMLVLMRAEAGWGGARRLAARKSHLLGGPDTPSSIKHARDNKPPTLPEASYYKNKIKINLAITWLFGCIYLAVSHSGLDPDVPS